MPVAARRGLAALTALALLALPRLSRAEEGERFFVDRPESDRELDKTAFDGSLTSTTFYYQESGVQGQPLAAGTTGPRSASPVSRLFTDLRAQLSARHISGGRYDFRADVRGRYSATATNPDGTQGNVLPLQSGTLSGNEAEIRELYVWRDGDDIDIGVGRQFVLELAAVHFDGIKLERQSTAEWKYLGFAGLYPTRGSRDIRTDYPTSVVDPSQIGVVQDEKRVMPLTGGLGGAYRFERAYGALGVVGIMPLFRDQTGKIEQPRVFATANGYWRKSQALDLYHNVVVDALGAAGAGLTTLAVGANYQPTQALHLTLQASRVDTETLNVQAQSLLEDPDQTVGDQLQNSIRVTRVAQESARLGISVGLKQNRFQVSTSGTLRRRPELQLASPDGNTIFVFPNAEALDIAGSFVDRRSWKDLRIGLSAVRSIGFGSVNLNRSKSTVVRLEAGKEIKGGKADVEGVVTYLSAADDNAGSTCVLTDIETCYGASKVSSVTVGGTGYYRLKLAWYLLGSVNVGRQSLTASDAAGVLQPQPAVTTASLFLRLAYRF